MTWPFLVWSAITVGRGSTFDVLRFGGYSVLEAIYRATMLFANLREAANHTIVKTDAYNALDPSEKGAVSYFLGMVLTKAYAEAKLDVPWLMHLDTYRDNLKPVSAFGRSRPDFVGRNLAGEWVVMESKGRTNGLDDSALIKAKDQTRRLTMVGGVAPSLRVGVVLHFDDGHLQLAASDPPGDSSLKEMVLRLNGEQFLESYYQPLRILLKSRESHEAVVADREFTITSLAAVDLTIGLSREIFLGKASVPPLGNLVGAEDEMDYVGSDGVFVRLGSMWGSGNMRKEPRDRDRIDG